MSGIKINQQSAQKIFDQLANQTAPQIKDPLAKKTDKSFAQHMKEGIQEVNETQKTADKMATELATGKTENIHETMIMATQAGLSFNLMVQVRNKALEAYQEIMRMPV